jgi:hypothetical protein
MSIVFAIVLSVYLSRKKKPLFFLFIIFRVRRKGKATELYGSKSFLVMWRPHRAAAAAKKERKRLELRQREGGSEKG